MEALVRKDTVRIDEAVTPAECEEVYRFRYGQYFAERGLPGTDASLQRVFLPHDAVSRHFMVREDGKLIGIATVTPADAGICPEWRELLAFAHIESLLPQVVVVSRVVVEEGMRHSLVFGRLCLHLARQCMAQGFHYAVHYCAPALVPLYERAGYRQYARGRNLAGGPFRVPMMLVVDDAAYMRRIRALFRVLAGPRHPQASAWTEQAYAACPELRRMPLAGLRPAEREALLRRLCPALDHRAVELLGKHHAALITLPAGCSVTAAQAGEECLFLLGTNQGEACHDPAQRLPGHGPEATVRPGSRIRGPLRAAEPMPLLAFAGTEE